MNAVAPPRLDPMQSLTIAAFNALIEMTLSRSGEPIPGYAARHLVERLQTSGLADVTSTADSLTMVLCGVRASAFSGSALTLLRNWQSAAADTIVRGARA